MSYNSHAEQFSRAARARFFSTPLVDARKVSYPAGWSRFDQVYSEIADATPTDRAWSRAVLIGACPSIAHYSERTQSEILGVVLRDMRALPADCDRLQKSGHQFVWVFVDRAAA